MTESAVVLAVGADYGKNRTKSGDAIKGGRGGRAGGGSWGREVGGKGGRAATVEQVPQGECVVV